MTNKKLYKDLTDMEKAIYNYNRRQYRTKQAQFEQRKVLNCSELGFIDVDDLTISVLNRMSGKVGQHSPHRPNLFRDDEL